MSLYFLDYSGNYESTGKEEEKDFGIFHFKNGKEKSKKRYLVPIIYDVSFKKVFDYNDEGAEIFKDFLNSILYPESKLIEEIKFLPKEILSNPHLVNNKGTRKVDYACIAKIMQKNKNEINEGHGSLENYNSEDNIVYKNVIIDVEMENNLTGDKVTSKCFNYGSSLRMKNDFMETWVIALCIDKSKNPGYDKGAKSYVAKEYNFEHKIEHMDYVKIYEIYLNGLFKAKDPPVSVLNKEKIGAEGKEWIKLLCLTLWCNSPANDKINYCIPEQLNFYGKQIGKAIDILADIQEDCRIAIKMQLFDEKQIEEDIEKRGYDKGEDNGYMNGYDHGFDLGFDNGYNEKNNKIVDYFYEVYKEKKYLEGTQLKGVLDMVSYVFLIEKYGKNPVTERFAKILDQNGLLLK